MRTLGFKTTTVRDIFFIAGNAILLLLLNL